MIKFIKSINLFLLFFLIIKKIINNLIIFIPKENDLNEKYKFLKKEVILLIKIFLL